MSRPVAVAITGGIGAGKSEALAAFRRQGAATLSADEVVHDLIANDEDVRAELHGRLGTTERGRIAEVVFGDAERLAWLEELLHPRVRERTDAWLEQVEAPVAVVEIPLLYETGGERRFDKVVVVTAPAEVREARRGGFSERAARLIPDEEKLRRADFAFVNDGGLEALDAFAASVVEELASSC